MAAAKVAWRRVELPIVRSAGPALADELGEKQAEPRAGRPWACGPVGNPLQGL